MYHLPHGNVPITRLCILHNLSSFQRDQYEPCYESFLRLLVVDHERSTVSQTPPSLCLCCIVHTVHTFPNDASRTSCSGTNIIAQHPQHNIYVRVESVGETTMTRSLVDRYKTPITVHVKTIKEGSVAENIELLPEAESARVMSVLVTARVLHSNQGNPLLKDGVHVVSHEHQDESEYTEWPGHGRGYEADDDEDSSMN